MGSTTGAHTSTVWKDGGAAAGAGAGAPGVPLAAEAADGAQLGGCCVGVLFAGWAWPVGPRSAVNRPWRSVDALMTPAVTDA